MDPRLLLLDTIPFLSPRPALDALAPDLADRRVPGAPHSIAEIVAHLAFWQDWFCRRCEGAGEPMPQRAAFGWPSPDPGSWDTLRQRFLEGADRLARIAESGDQQRRVDPPLEFPPLATYTIEEVVVHVANHNAHHLGQVVLLRQMLGAWPPPAGSYTW